MGIHGGVQQAAVLQAYGDRIQRSVFLATIDTDTLAEIRDRARDIG